MRKQADFEREAWDSMYANCGGGHRAGGAACEDTLVPSLITSVRSNFCALRRPAEGKTDMTRTSPGGWETGEKDYIGAD